MIENQRIRLTKMLLKESLTTLLHEKSIHKISVREVCSAADINRTTFYKYYGSQYDLLREMEEDVLLQIEHVLSSTLDSATGIEHLKQTLMFIDENLDLCKILFNNSIDIHFLDKLIEIPTIVKFNNHLNEEYNEYELSYIFAFIMDGALSIIRQWINKPNHESPETMANLIISTIMKLFPEDFIDKF